MLKRLLATVLALGILAGSHAEEAVNIDLLAEDWPGFFPARIAQANGLFTDRGLDLKIHFDDNYVRSFEQGKYDALALSLGTVYRFMDKHPGARIVMFTDLSAGADMIVSLRDMPKSFASQRICIEKDSFSELFVRRFLADKNTGTHAVSLVDCNTYDALRVLQANEADMAHVWQPVADQVLAAGGKRLYSSWNTPGLIPDVIFFRETFLRQQPEAVAAFIAAWFDAVDWWRANPDQAALIFDSKHPSRLQKRARGIKILTQEDNLESMQNPRSPRYLPKTIESYSTFFHNNGIVARKLPLDALVDLQYLHAAVAQRK